MICPKCGNANSGGSKFCIKCGNSLEIVNSKTINPSIGVDNKLVQSQNFNINKQNVPVQSTKKKNKSKVELIIILVVLILIIIGAGLFFFFNKKEEDKPSTNNKQPESVVVVDEKTSLQKLEEDYNAGKIDVNKYFTELVNYDYDYDNLDEKYKSDTNIYTSGNISNIVELLENHSSEISEDSVRKLLEKATLQDVSLGNEVNVKKQANNGSGGSAVLLKDEEDKEKISSHNLDKVYLSKNEHFLIWYTETGNDGISKEQLVEIANELEDSIWDYEKMFNTEYLYKPYYDELINKNYFNAREILKDNGINASKIDTAMNVYIYDTGSDGTLATYYNPHDSGVLLETIILLGIDDLYLGESGIVSYPYVVLNRAVIDDSLESLKSVANHELFHHFQYLYCVGTEQQVCPSGDYLEATANLASALVSEINSSNGFLNRWYGRYVVELSSELSTIGGGYGQFPYYYAYTKVVDDWAVVLTEALNEVDVTRYIKNNTSQQDLIKISEMITYNTLSKKYDNKALYTDTDVVIQDIINSPKDISSSIAPGAIKYYEVAGDNTLKVISGNSEYVGIKLYGYKDGIYKEIQSSMESIEVDLTYYVRYDKFYLAIYNADIVSPSKYTIKMTNSEYEENSEYVTTFNNYNIEIEMNITISGMNTKTVSTGVVDELHQKEYLDVTTTSMGIISLNNKIYYDFNTGYTYMTQPYGGDVWWKEKSASQMVDLGAILDKLISMKNVTKISENHYKIKMTQEDVKGLMSSGNAGTSTLSGDIYVEVYTENGYITKLEYDFSKMISGFEEFTTTIKYSNYDNAGDVEIPQSIIDNAKEQ